MHRPEMRVRHAVRVTSYPVMCSGLQRLKGGGKKKSHLCSQGRRFFSAQPLFTSFNAALPSLTPGPHRAMALEKKVLTTSSQGLPTTPHFSTSDLSTSDLWFTNALTSRTGASSASPFLSRLGCTLTPAKLPCISQCPIIDFN